MFTSKRKLSSVAVGALAVASMTTMTGVTAQATPHTAGTVGAAATTTTVHKPFTLPRQHRTPAKHRPNAIPRHYSLTAMLPAGATWAQGAAINNRGDVAVVSNDIAYLYVKGKATKLSLHYTDQQSSGAFHSEVMALNDRDQMLGRVDYNWAPGGSGYTRTAYVAWASPTADPTTALGADKVSVAQAWMNNAGVGVISGLGYGWDQGPVLGVVPAGSLNLSASDRYLGLSDRSDVVGYRFDPNKGFDTPGSSFVQAKDGTRVTLPGLVASEVPLPAAISGDGTMIVGVSKYAPSGTSTEGVRPVYWDAKRVVHPMTGAPADFTPVGVNNSGAVLGHTSNGVPGVWTRGTYVSLATVTTPAGMSVCFAEGINNAGQVVASLCSTSASGVQRAVVLTPKA